MTEIKRALINRVRQFDPPLSVGVGFAYEKALKEERQSRSVWAKSLADKAGCLSSEEFERLPFSKRKLLADAVRELLRVAEEDGVK